VGLGTTGYVSTMGLLSTAAGLASYITTFIDPVELASTVAGLGSASFISSLQLQLNITSTVTGLGSATYVSSTQLTSTVRGLGSSGYVSSLTFVTLVSSQQILASSIGVNCNSPAYQLDVAGSIHGNYFSSVQVTTSSFFGSLADAFTVIVYDI